MLPHQHSQLCSGGHGPVGAAAILARAASEEVYGAGAHPHEEQEPGTVRV
jgi:Pyruvate/2-oxoacid:ferredoxin oxidoreductase gamma subunit